jgi:hypothetical protein
MKLYRHCIIFILGDIEFDGMYYQCSMMNKVVIPSKIKNCQYVKYTKSFRFDTELNDNLDQLRTKMVEYNGNIQLLKKWVDNSDFKNCYKSIDSIKYNDIDVGISCTNEMGEKSKHLTEKFIEKGTKPKYFIKNTNLLKN